MGVREKTSLEFFMGGDVTIKGGVIPGNITFRDADAHGGGEALRLRGADRVCLVYGVFEPDPVKVVAAFRGWLARALQDLGPWQINGRGLVGEIPGEGSIFFKAGDGAPSLELSMDGTVLLNGVVVEKDDALRHDTRELLRRLAVGV